MEIFPLDRQEQREPFWKRYYLNSCCYTTKKWLRQIIIFCKIKFVSYHSTTSERRTMGDIFRWMWTSCRYPVKWYPKRHRSILPLRELSPSLTLSLKSSSNMVILVIRFGLFKRSKHAITYPLRKNWEEKISLKMSSNRSSFWSRGAVCLRQIAFNGKLYLGSFHIIFTIAVED